MRFNSSFVGVLGLILFSQNAAFAGAWVSATGATTPTEISMTLTGVSLVTTDGTELTLFSGSQTLSFKRADRDFATVSVGNIIVPEGRYKKVKFTLSSSLWNVKLSGTRYDGSTQGSLAAGDTISTTGTVSARDSSITESTAAGNLLPNLGSPGTTSSGEFGGESPFGGTVCVASAQSKCQSGDIWVGGAQRVPNIIFMLDMYRTVLVDGANMALAYSYSTYPFVTIGAPGAAIHLSATSGGDLSDITLFFNNDRTFAYGAVNSIGTATTRYGNTFVATASEDRVFAGTFTQSSGQIRMPVANRDLTTRKQKSNGLLTIANVKQSVGATTTITCSDDTSGSLGGVSYTGSNALAATCGTLPTYTITRVVDPDNNFSICTSGYVTGMTGSCSNSATTDGYP